MTLRLSLHAHSVWPVSVDFDILRAYTAGFTIEESVAHIMQVTTTLSNNMNRKSSKKEIVLNPSAVIVKEEENLQTSNRMGESSRCEIDEELQLSPKLNNENSSTSPEVLREDMGDLTIEKSRRESGINIDAGENIKQSFEVVEKSMSDIGLFEDKQILALASSRNRGFFRTSSNKTLHQDLQEVISHIAASEIRFLREAVEEQYNLFNMLRDNYLSTPYAFLSSYSIPMTLKDRRRVVEVFYSVDDVVLKLFFGERLDKLGLDGESDGHFLFGARGKRNLKINKLIYAGLSEGSLRRQWKNLKWVCNFIVAAYHGREGMLIPCTTPLSNALQQCFAMRGELKVRYSTFVFAYEHRLKGRFWEKLSYENCTTVCHVIASLWCDDSQLMLRDNFRKVCIRIARILDESRIIAEMHQMAFGEAMRPRWQVQLDEMQRAISTNTVVVSNNNTSINANNNNNTNTNNNNNSSVSVMGINTIVPSPTTSVPPTLLPRNTSTLPLDSLTEGQLSSTPSTPVSGLNNTTTSNNNNTTISNTVNTQSSTSQNHPQLSANSAFSRRFLLEFPFIFKCLVRMASAIGNSANLQEALEMFYTRVYLSLELIGSRSLMAQNFDISSPRVDTLSHVLDSYSNLPESSGKGGGNNNSTLKSFTELGTGNSEEVREEVESCDNFTRAGKFNNDENIYGISAVSTNAVVNTSLVGPAITRAIQRPSIPLTPRLASNSAGNNNNNNNNSGGAGGGINNNNNNNNTGSVNSKVYLCELCMFLSLLPNIFVNLTILTEEDHAECDGDFANFILALKVMVQIIMASDDH